MSKRTVIDCDRCGKQACPSAKTVSVTVGSQTDGAGSRDYLQEDIDLCPDCLFTCLTRFVGALNEREAQAWVETNRRTR
jgi:hypothetical protein